MVQYIKDRRQVDKTEFNEGGTQGVTPEKIVGVLSRQRAGSA